LTAIMRQNKRQEVMSARKVEVFTQNRRAEEQRVRDLQQYSKECQRLSINANRRASVPSQRKQENDVEKRQHLEQARREAALKHAEENIIEKEKKQRDMEREKLEREIQRICESSEELRELERTIKIAYVNKERAAQHQETLLLKKVDSFREQIIEEEMEQKRQELIRIEEEKEIARRQKLVSQKCGLQGQMKEREVRNYEYDILLFSELDWKENDLIFIIKIGLQIQLEQARLEALKDMEMVDQVLAQINEETRSDAERKNSKREETKVIIREYQNEREEYKRLFAQQEKEQEDSIYAYDQMMQDREEEKRRKGEELDAEKKRTWKKVADDAKNFNRSRDDYNDLRDLLWEQERQEREKQEEEEAFRKKLQQRGELLRQNQEQIEAKRALLAKMDVEEEELVKKMLEKFAADECEEMEKQLCAIKAKEQYVEEASLQRKEKENIFKQEKMREKMETQKAAEIDEYKQAVIAAARRALLEKHRSQLEGFLPELDRHK